MLACIGIASEAMFGREDGHYVELVFLQYVQQMFVSYHTCVVGEDGNPFSFQDGEVFGSLLVAHDDSIVG